MKLGARIDIPCVLCSWKSIREKHIFSMPATCLIHKAAWARGPLQSESSLIAPHRLFSPPTPDDSAPI